MQNYIINSGDNLWSIAKSLYKDKPASNGDIQKTVDKIVEENGIENPNSIYAGDSLRLPELESIFGTDEKNESQNEEGNVFSDFDNWMDAHATNMKTLNKVLDEGTKTKGDPFSEYSKQKEKIGLTFDFMDGKDFNNEEEYNAQLSKLGKGEIASKDRNDDDKITSEEYFIQEAAPAIVELKENIKNGTMTMDDAVNTLSELYHTSNAVFNIIDAQMGDGNEYLTEDEFATYYSGLDNYAGDENKSAKDGKIEIDYVTEYPEYLASQITPFEDLDEETKANLNKIATTLLSGD